MTVRLFILSVCIAASLGFACQGDSRPAEEPGPVNQVAYARQMMAQTSPEQLPAFDDLTITLEEYEKANYDTMACMTEAGIQITDVFWYGERQINFGWSGFAPGSPQYQSTDAIYEECYRRYSSEINMLWTSLKTPTQAEFDDAIDQLLDCIKERGGGELTRDDIRTSRPLDMERLQELYKIPGYTECHQSILDETGIAPSLRE